MYELVMHVRDNFGKPTGKTKSVVTLNPADLSNFYVKMRSGVRQLKRRGVKLNPKPID